MPFHEVIKRFYANRICPVVKRSRRILSPLLLLLLLLWALVFGPAYFDYKGRPFQLSVLVLIFIVLIIYIVSWPYLTNRLWKKWKWYDDVLRFKFFFQKELWTLIHTFFLGVFVVLILFLTSPIIMSILSHPAKRLGTTNQQSTGVSVHSPNNANSNNLSVNYPEGGDRFDATALGSALLTFVALAVTFGSWIVVSRTKQVDEMVVRMKEVNNAALSVTKIVFGLLPSYSLTIHIPDKIRDLLRQIDVTYDDNDVLRVILSRPAACDALDIENIRSHARIGLLKAILRLSEGKPQNAIGILEKLKKLQEEMAFYDDKQDFDVRYRLTIAFRQIGDNIQSWKECINLVKNAKGQHYKAYGQVAAILTAISCAAEESEDQKYDLWNGETGENKVFKEKLDEFSDLNDWIGDSIDNPQETPYYITFYCIRAYQLLKRTDHEDTIRLAIEHVIEQMKNGYACEEDEAIKANYALGMGMLARYAGDPTRSAKLLGQAKSCAVLVEKQVGDGVTILSERSMREIPVKDFKEDVDALIPPNNQS